MKRGKLQNIITLRLGLVVVVALELLLQGFTAHAESLSALSVRTLKAMEVAENCVVFRVLVDRTGKQLEDSRLVFSKQLNLVKGLRAEFETCARKKGIVSIVSDRDEALSVELCPVQYGSWVQLSYELEVTREDVSTAVKSLQMLKVHLGRQCSTLPNVPKGHEVRVKLDIPVLSAYAVSE